MTGYVGERKAIWARFDSGWDGRTWVDWPGIGGRPPKGEAWVRFGIQNSPSAQISVGGSQDLYRHDGAVVLEVFAPLGEGEDPALELADAAADVFRGWRGGGLKFFAPYVTQSERRDGHWKVDVICPFERDERLTRAS